MAYCLQFVRKSFSCQNQCQTILVVYATFNIKFNQTWNTNQAIFKVHLSSPPLCITFCDAYCSLLPRNGHIISL